MKQQATLMWNCLIKICLTNKLWTHILAKFQWEVRKGLQKSLASIIPCEWDKLFYIISIQFLLSCHDVDISKFDTTPKIMLIFDTTGKNWRNLLGWSINTAKQEYWNNFKYSVSIFIDISVLDNTSFYWLILRHIACII